MPDLGDITIRAATAEDWPKIWEILEPVFRAGETYPHPTDINKAQAHPLWMQPPYRPYVAVDESGHVLGTYYLKPNQIGQGAHVCNAGYAVGEAARGRGIARTMCEHSQDEACRLGYRAMQFNLVVSTNHVAVRLWNRLGFATVGTLPGAFDHPTLGEVDALVMYQRLDRKTP